MFPLQNVKFAAAKHPASENGTAADGVTIDTLGYHSLTVIVQAGAVGANMDSLKMQNSDDGSTWGDVTNGAFTAPTTSAANTVAAGFFTVPAKRYYRVQSDAGASVTLLSALAILQRANQSPETATERGLGQQIIL